jgi:GGDEF domain-containing protein
MSHWGGAALISIRKAADELDRMEELLRTIAANYGHSIGSTGQYAVEVDHLDANVYREHMQSIKTQAERASTVDDWQQIQASFRDELRDYRDKSSERIRQLKQDINSAVKAMQVFADSVAISGADHEEQLKGALMQLHGVAKSNNLPGIRVIVESATQTIEASFEKLQKEHQLVIAQLRDELRLLHQQIEAERRVAFLDRATGVWNRQKTDSHIAQLLSNDEPFCILLVHLRNLRRLQGQYSRNVIEGAIKAFLQRFANMVGDDCALGRWNEEDFAAVLQVEPSVAMTLSREAAKRLTGLYSVQENGLSQTVPLQAIAGLIDRAAGADGPTFQQKLLQMSDALANA